MPITPKSTAKPQEFAAIDLGSNSFHMVIARVVDGAMQVLGRLKQRVHLADGLDSHNVLSEDAIQRGLGCLALFAERLQSFSPTNVTIVGTHTLREAANAQEFLQRAAEVIPYPIEVISGNEEARLIFMGVEHTQPEKGRKLVIDIGGGSTELVIGEDFEPKLVESRRMGCVSFANLYFPNGMISKENFRRARLAAVQKLETLAWQYRLKGWQFALGASGTIKAACEVLQAMGEKDKLITPERLQLLYDEVVKHKSFDALSLPGLSEERKGCSCLAWRSCAACLMPLLFASCAFPAARCVKACCMKWKVVFVIRIFAAERRKAWRIIMPSTATRRVGCWKPPGSFTVSGVNRTPGKRIRSWGRC